MPTENEKLLRLKVKFLSNQNEVTEMVRAAETWLRDCGAGTEFVGDVALVLAEALNNVVEHAYKYREDGIIDVELAYKGTTLQMMIEDRGEIFPGLPEKKTMTGPEQELHDLPEGGFGWFLIHSLTTAMEYEHQAGKNHLALKLEEPQSAPV